jgi:hypothetical protein
LFCRFDPIWVLLERILEHGIGSRIGSELIEEISKCILAPACFAAREGPGPLAPQPASLYRKDSGPRPVAPREGSRAHISRHAMGSKQAPRLFCFVAARVKLCPKSTRVAYGAQNQKIWDFWYLNLGFDPFDDSVVLGLLLDNFWS